MNWGNKLILAFVLFALFIGYMVSQSFNTRFDLVSNNYYNEELRYQEKLNAIKNTNKLSNVEVFQNSNLLVIFLPKELKDSKISGSVLMYCNTDKAKDFKLDFKDSLFIRIDKTKLQAKNYILKLNWKSDTTNYYFEKNIKINS